MTLPFKLVAITFYFFKNSSFDSEKVMIVCVCEPISVHTCLCAWLVPAQPPIVEVR